MPAGPGGLVAALLSAASRLGATWLYAPATDSDREIARLHPDGIAHDAMVLRATAFAAPRARSAL